MPLHCQTGRSENGRSFASSVRCPHCGDWMVAPVVSEFVRGGEIRHHWECDRCGEHFETSLAFTTH